MSDNNFDRVSHDTVYDDGYTDTYVCDKCGRTNYKDDRDGVYDNGCNAPNEALAIMKV